MKTTSNGRRIREVDPMESLRADLTALRHDFAALTNAGVNRISNYGKEKLNGVASSVTDVADTAKDHVNTAQKRVETFASERPMATIAIALAAGAIGGKLLGWMMRR